MNRWFSTKTATGPTRISHRNLLNMRRFYNEYQHVIIVQSLTAQFKNIPNVSILPSATAEIGRH